MFAAAVGVPCEIAGAVVVAVVPVVVVVDNYGTSAAVCGKDFVEDLMMEVAADPFVVAVGNTAGLDPLAAGTPLVSCADRTQHRGPGFDNQPAHPAVDNPCALDAELAEVPQFGTEDT